MRINGARIVRWTIPVIIVALAIFTRLSNLDIVEFRGDEAAVSTLSMLMVHGSQFPMIGIGSSVGVDNPPVFIYLMAIPYLLSENPAIATGFIGLLGVLSVLICYLFTKKYFGETAAVISSLLLAVSPWMVMYTRKIWAQDVLSFFTLLLMVSIYAYVVRKRSWHLVPAFLWAAMLPQIHIAGMAGAIILVIVILVYRSAFRWQPFFAGVVIALLVAAPYLYWEAAHGWILFSQLSNVAKLPAQFDLTVIIYVFNLVGSAPMYTVGVPGEWEVARIAGVLFILAVLSVLCQLMLIWTSKIEKDSRLLVLQMIWLVVPIAIFLRHSTGVYPYYILPVFPLPFILIGVFLSEIENWVRAHLAQYAIMAAPTSYLRWVPGTLIGVFLAVTVAVQVTSFIALIDGSRSGSFNGLGTPLMRSQQLVNQVDQLRASSPQKAVYLADIKTYFSMVFGVIKGGKLDFHAFDTATTLVLPSADTGEVLYITTDEQSPAATTLKRLATPASPSLIGNPGEGIVFSTYNVSPQESLNIINAVAPKALPLLADNGLEVIGCDYPTTVRQGESFTIAITLHLGPNWDQVRRDYGVFTHLLDGKNKGYSGNEWIGYPSMLWQPGESIVIWQTLVPAVDEAPGQYWVEFGMYDRADGKRLMFNKKEGELVGSAPKLGPIKVLPQTGVPRETDATVQFPLRAQLQDEVTMLGYDLSANEVSAGGNLSLSLHWLAGKPHHDYTVFVQLLNVEGKLVAQQDSAPCQGSYPTSFWDQGEYVKDTHTLQIPTGLPKGTYQLIVGMYQLGNGQRLAVVGDNGRTSSDYITLNKPIVVK